MRLGRAFRIKWASRFKRLFVSLFVATLTAQAGFAGPSNITASDPSVTQVVEQNNVSVVNIATPSARGVSHNRFTDFNVNASGVVINNALQAGDSVLLQAQLNANANLNAAAARLILNEVVSTRRSRLAGTTELFGENAGYILANPNGVTCDGCSFIRTPTLAGDTDRRLSEVMLTTGVPGVDASGVDPLRIDVNPASSADIIIGPGGLNATQVDATTLLTRELRLEGLIEAANNELRVIAGGGSLTVAEGAAPGARPWTAAQATTNPITVAIDAAATGAMHAGQIYIQATEQGVGVTLAGDLISTNGDIEITADGNIQYKTADAAGSLTVATQQTGAQITATGNSTAAGDITWNLTGNGTLDGPGSVRFQAGRNIQFNCGGATACQVTGRDNTSLSARQLNTTAKLQTIAGRDLTIAANLESAASIESGGELVIQAVDGDLHSQDVLTAAGDMRLISAAGGHIRVDGAVRSGGDLYLLGTGTYDHVDRAGDSIAGDWVIDLFELNNNGRLSDLKDGQLRVGWLVNSGVIQNEGVLQLTVDDLLDNAGVIHSLEGIVRINHSQSDRLVGEIRNRGEIAALNLTQNQNPESSLLVDTSFYVARHQRAILAGAPLSAKDLGREIQAGNRALIAELTADTNRLGALELSTLLLHNSGRLAGGEVWLRGGTLNNTGGVISAAGNLRIEAAVLNNTNAPAHLGVITSRNNLDIELTTSLTNQGQIESRDIVIQAPVQQNLNSALSSAPSVATVLPTQSLIEDVGGQGQFVVTDNDGPYYRYRRASGAVPGIDSDPARLTQAFLSDAEARLAPNTVILGDDIYLSTLIGRTVSAQGGLPFVTADRHDLLQLGTLYRNTLEFMARTGLRFGELPGASAQAELTTPILAFSVQVLADGRSAYVPDLYLPAGGGGADSSRFDALITQIFAQNELLLRGDQITNSASLKAGGTLTIEAVDLTQDSDQRNWYVDAEGQIQYRGPQIVAGRSVAIRLTGDYVQNGGQLIAQDRVAVAAANIFVQGAPGGNTTTPPARVSAGDDLYLLAESRAEYGRQVEIESQGDALLRAGGALGFDGQLLSQGDAQLLGESLRLGASDTASAFAGAGPSMRVAGSLRLQADQDIKLTAADIRVGAPEYAKAGRGELVLLAETGDIVNTAGRLWGETSVAMQAGGDIVNQSLLRVREESTHTKVRGAGHRGWGRGRHTIDSRYQYVEVAGAEIRAGAGGITQIAGGDIRNLGATVKSGGDLYQKADGDILNQSLAQRYLKAQRIEKWSTAEVRRHWDDYSDRSRVTGLISHTQYDVTRQVASLSAAGHVIQQAGGKIQNIGGRIDAQKSLLQRAGSGIENRNLLTQAAATDVRRVTVSDGRRGSDYDDWGRNYSRGNVSERSSTTVNHLLTGTLSAGESIIAQVGDDETAGGDWFNEGNITAGQDVLLAARDIRNVRQVVGQQVLDTGRLKAGGDIVLNAERDITDVAGRYDAGGDITLLAGGDIRQQAIVLTDSRALQATYNFGWGDRRFKRTINLGHHLTIRAVTGKLDAGAGVTLQAGGDLVLAATDIRAQQDIRLSGRNVRLEAVETRDERSYHAGRTRQINRTVRHEVAELEAGGSLLIQAENELTTYGSQLRAGSDADDHIVLNAGDDLRLLGVNNEDYYYYYRKKKRSFGRSKTTIVEDRSVTLVETQLSAGGSLLVNIAAGEYGDLTGRDSAQVVLAGTRIDVGQDALVYGGDSVNVLSGIEYEFHRREKHKRGFGGFSRSGRVHSREARRLGHAEIQSGGDTVLLSGGDINVVAGRISAANIVAEAGFGADEEYDEEYGDAERQASIRIIGEKEALATFDHKYKTSFKLSLEDNFLSIAEERHNKHWQVDENYIGSLLQAQGNISLKAKDMVQIIGSELSAGRDLQLAANDIRIDPARDYNLDKDEESIKRIGIEITADGNGINAFAGLETKTLTDEYTLDAIHASLLTAGNQIQIQAHGDIAQVSSDLLAGGDIYLRAGGAIVLDAEHTIESNSHTETVRRTGVSVGLQHNYESTRQAVKNAGEGDNTVSEASSVLRAVDAIDSFLSGPSASAFAGTTTTSESSTETTALARGSRIEGGGDVRLQAGADISLTGAQVLAQYDIDLRATDVDIKAAENRYRQNTDFHTERTGIIASGQKNSASIGVGGSFADQDSDYVSTWAQASLLSAGRTAEIQADRDIRVTSSDLEAFDDLIMLAGRDVYLGAQGFGSDYHEDGRSGGAEVGIAATVSQDGAALGIYGSANYARNELDRAGTTYRNSHLNAGNRLTLQSGQDTVVRGATAEADQLELNVGRDLTLASIQDTGRAEGRRYDVNGRVIVGVGPVSVSGSLGQGETDGDKAWVEEQTRLIGRESVKVRIEGHTALTGAVIAAKSGDLTLDTGTLAFNDLHDKDRERSYYANISLSFSRERGDNPQQQHNNRQTNQPVRSGRQADGGGGPGGTFSGYYANHDRRQINRATIGDGTILVRQDQATGPDSTAGLNRDIRLAQQITRDERDEINLYVSDSSVRSVAGMFKSDDPKTKANENTFGRWTDDALNYHTNTAEAITSLLRSGEYGIDVANAVGSVFGGASFSEAFQQAHSAIAGRVAAWQITKFEQDAALILKNAETESPEKIQAAAQLLARTMANLSGVDQDILVKAMLEDVRAVSFKGATDGQNIYVDFNPDGGTSVSNSGDIANVLGHEVGHIAGSSEQGAEYLGDVSEQAWQNELERSGFGGDPYDADADKVWVSTNRDDSLLRENTTSLYQVDPGRLEFRQLKLAEANVLDVVRQELRTHPDLTLSEKQQALLQLDALACAKVKCAAGVSMVDKHYGVLTELQALGEQLQAQGLDLTQILGEDIDQALFQYGKADWVNDLITRHNEVAVRSGGVLRASAGGLGVVGGVTLTAGGVASCGVTFGAGCAAATVAGVPLTALSAAETYSGLEQTFGHYESLIGQQVFDSFSLETHQDNDSPLWALGKGALIGTGELALAKVGGRYLSKGLEKWRASRGSTTEILDDGVGAARVQNSQVKSELPGAKTTANLPGPKLNARTASTFENGIYTNRQLTTDTKFYKYHGIDNRTGKKVSWVTDRKYDSEQALREGLAIRHDWGVRIDRVTEFNVPKGAWVSEGRAVTQGVGYPGGDYQAVLHNLPKSQIIRTDRAFQ